jgi:PPK2 family polyphosphate:nucleotide phosphotransferase
MKKFDLKKVDPADTGKFREKGDAAKETDKLLDEMYRLLYLMFAEDKRSLLVILQGIDASGKDGVVRHIFAGANPQGVRVYSFKAPSGEELKHDYLWRCHRVMPERGTTAIFNRSYYEDVTTVRVHPEYLKERNIDGELDLDELFERRYRQINEFEKMLTENGTMVLKFFLHISRKEQKERLEERLSDRSKNWKFSAQDVKERKLWKEHRAAFEKMLHATSTKHSPWHVIPADHKWYRNYAVSKIIVEKLAARKMLFPALKERVRIPD